ncbi:MAG: dolichol-P-glucose synthetase, partial [Acidobacteria bacterium]
MMRDMMVTPMGTVLASEGVQSARTDMTHGVEVSVVIPCLNEANSLAYCVDKAMKAFQVAGLSGEVVVADNGSTDGSIQIAEQHGARVIRVAERGYGAALRAGIAGARGPFIIMGDADDSYDFTDVPRFVKKLREGNDIVLGNRFWGEIKPGAMPPLHKY